MKKNVFIALVLVALAIPVFGQTFVAQDPTRYIPNARVLGLGKAYLGLANDTGAIYTNPAGLTDADNWQLTTMSGKFLNEYNYLSLSGFYPTEYGVFALGYASTSIGGAYATTIESWSDPNDPIYTIDPNQTQMGNNNDAFIISYANFFNQLGFLKQVPLAERMALGANAKIFKARLYGDGIVGGDASGFDADLGVKIHPPQTWMALGLNLKNFIPSSMGGKLRYASGHEESYPTVFEGGAAFNILGKPGTALASSGDNELRLMADFEMHPTLANYPLVLHVGTEWSPLANVVIRAGLDQDAASNGSGGLTVVNDLAYGVGLNFYGFRFDYAYHTFAGAPGIDNHYFSLSYGLLEKQKAPELIALDSPADRLSTFESSVKVEGRLIDTSIRSLTINGNPVKYSLRGFFSTPIDLKIGKNLIVIEARNAKGEKVLEKRLGVIRLYTYTDVPASYWAAQPISLLAMAEIAGGYPDGTFKPEGDISRAELCAMLMRSKLGTERPTARSDFNDVPPEHWAAGYVAAAVDAGVAKGYPGNLFKPNGKVTRAEGLAMIVRFAGVTDEVYARQYEDVFGRHWVAPIIAGAHKAGMLQYLKGATDFFPNRKLTRAEAVELLYRTPYMQTVLNNTLFKWETEDEKQT